MVSAILRLEELRKMLEDMCRILGDNDACARTKARRMYNVKAGFVPYNLRINEYVLIHPSKLGRNKLDTEWIGP